MNFSKTLKQIIPTAGFLLAGLLGGDSLALAQDSQAPNIPRAEVVQEEKPNTASTRVEVELSEKVDSHISKVTTGVSPVGKGKACEYIRSYSYFGHKDTKLGEVEVNYTAAAAKTPELKLGKTRHEITLFGMTGTSEGWGIETRHKFSKKMPKFELTLNAEGRTTKGNEALRLGAGLDYKKEGLVVGGAFDTVTTNNDRTNQYFAHVTYNATPVDMVGSALELKTNPAGNTEKAGFVYTHYDPKDQKNPKEKWGTRTWATFTNNHATDTKTFYFTSATSQNPTWTREAGELTMGRNSKDMFDDMRVTEQVLGSESSTLPERTNRGFAFQPELTYTENSKGKTTSAAMHVSYTANIKGFFVAPKLSYSIKSVDPETGRGELTDRLGGVIEVKKTFQRGCSFILEAGHSEQIRKPKTQPLSGHTDEDYMRIGGTLDW